MQISTQLALAGTFAVAFVVTVLLAVPVIRLCLRFGWVAQPGGRRQHVRPTPAVGGIAIYAGFAVAVAATYGLGSLVPQLQRDAFEQLRVGLVLLGGTLIFLVMWLDDVVELKPLAKLTGQLAAALIAVGPFLWDRTLYPPDDQAYGIILTAFNFPFTEQIHLFAISPWLAIAATIFWIVGMNNTINFLDGMDGLATGVSLIAALALALNALSNTQYSIALLPLALAGACAGFLLFNFPPARMFMGDSGAEFIGYVLAVSAIIGGAKLATILLVLGVPILDVAWLIVSRLRNRQSPAHSGRDHLHHRLRDLGLSQRQVLLFYYTLSVSFGLLGVARVDSMVKLVALLLLGIVMAVVLLVVTRRSRVNAGQEERQSKH